jgi:hypothetical protein
MVQQLPQPALSEVLARLLREHAHQIGLEPTFTIHDREDSADRM